MAELKPRDPAQRDDEQAGKWMLPSAALEQFEPPTDLVLAAAEEKEIGRYGFKIGSLGLLIQEGCGSEVMQIPAIWTLPGSPP